MVILASDLLVSSEFHNDMTNTHPPEESDINDLKSLRERLAWLRFKTAILGVVACIFALTAAVLAIRAGEMGASSQIKWGVKEVVMTGTPAILAGAAVFVARLIAGVRP